MLLLVECADHGEFSQPWRRCEPASPARTHGLAFSVPDDAPRKPPSLRNICTERPDGTKIEVKSSGLLQAWAQKKLSTPRYRVPAAYGWDSATDAWSMGQGFHADVYVFCLHNATTHEEYDPLAVSQWSFHVATRVAIEAQAGASMGLATLTRIAGDPVGYSDLREAISIAAEARQLP